MKKGSEGTSVERLAINKTMIMLNYKQIDSPLAIHHPSFFVNQFPSSGRGRYGLATRRKGMEKENKKGEDGEKH